MRPRINWFSPLPPAKSGIAGDYVTSVVPELARISDLTLWTAQSEWNRDIESFAKVFRFSSGDNEPKLSAPAINIYNIGNNRDFHAEIFEVARRIPGIVILHDLNLLDFFAGLYSEKESLPDLAEFMEIEAGKLGRHVAAVYRDGALHLKRLRRHFTFVRAAVSNAFGIVVHSRAGFDEFANRDRWPVARLHLPQPDRPLLPRRRQSGPGQLRLLMFGYIGSNRCIEQLLLAMASYRQPASLHLDVLGTLWPGNPIAALVERLGISDRVHFHGFVSDEALDEALATADLAVNLRYPTMGEASASQLRIWQSGTPSLVTPVGWYREQPAEIAGWVRPGHEAADLHKHFDAFLADPAFYEEMGKRGRAHYLAHHLPVTYANDLVAFAEHAANYRPHALAQRLLHDVLPCLHRT